MHNILIVEDDEVLNNGIQYCLNDEKLHTHGVYSFQQAEASINKSNYDLVILDVTCIFSLSSFDEIRTTSFSNNSPK